MRALAPAALILRSHFTGYPQQVPTAKLHFPRDRQIARGLRLTDNALAFLGKVRDIVQEATGAFTFRIAGDIGASTPVEPGNGDFATYDEDETITVDASLLPKKRDNLFAVRVRGNSMLDALARDRDIVIMERITTARNRPRLPTSPRLATLVPFLLFTTRKFFREMPENCPCRHQNGENRRSPRPGQRMMSHYCVERNGR